MFQGAAFDCSDDLVRHAQHRVVAESDQDGLVRAVGGEAGFSQSRFDDRGEIAVRDMPDIGPGDEAAGENAAEIGIARLLDAVGGHQDGAGEGIELVGLILPRAAVIADEVLVGLEFGITVGGQHLAVGIDVDAFPFGLLEQFFEVLEVMAGNEDGLAFDRFDADRGGDWMAVGGGVGAVQHFHDLEVDFAAAENQAKQGVDRVVGVGEEIQGFVEKRVHRVGFDAQSQGVMGVGRGALDAVDEQFLQAGDIFADGGLAPQDRNHFALGGQRRQVRGGRPRGRAAQGFGSSAVLFAGSQVKGPGLVTHLGGMDQDLFESERIEVDIGDGGKQGFDHEMIHRAVLGAELPGAMGVLTDALGGVDEQVLEGGGLGVFAADAGIGAAGHAESLFTLIAKHGFSVSVVVVDVAAGREDPAPTFDAWIYTGLLSKHP